MSETVRMCPHCGCGCGEVVVLDDADVFIIDGNNPTRRWLRAHGEAAVGQRASEEDDPSLVNLLLGRAVPCRQCE
jgi:hypothetical protein